MTKTVPNINPHNFDEELLMIEDFIRNFKITKNRKKRIKYMDKI